MSGPEERRFKYLHGSLAYRKRSTGELRGREQFALTVNRDGTRTLRSLAMTDDSEFVRDVIYTLGTDLSPEEVLIRLMVGDQFVGSGHFTRDGDRLRLSGRTAADGLVEQTLTVPLPFHMMTHAVMLDGWSFWGHDQLAGAIEVPVYITSKQWNGTDGPVGSIETLRIEALGEREMTVPAGTYPCRGFSVTAPAIDSPPSEIWVTGEHLLLVRYDWPGFDLEYVLTELS